MYFRNPIYAILEHPRRWFILAGLCLLAGFLGAEFALAYAWPHVIGQVWFWLLFAGAVVCAVQGVREWRQETEQAIVQDERRSQGSEPG